MSSMIHFDPRAVRPVMGGVVVSFDSTHVPNRAEVIETAQVVTITLFDDRTNRKQRFSRYLQHEVFVPLDGPLTCRIVIDGAAASQQYARAPMAPAVWTNAA